jgi:hypothetical protein
MPVKQCSAFGILAVFGFLLDLLADLLDVLAGTGHGVAGSQGRGRKHGQQHYGDQTLHVGSPRKKRNWDWADGACAPSASLWNASLREADVENTTMRGQIDRGVQRAAGLGTGQCTDFRRQSRIRVELPNWLSNRSTSRFAVALRESSA